MCQLTIRHVLVDMLTDAYQILYLYPDINQCLLKKRRRHNGQGCYKYLILPIRLKLLHDENQLRNFENPHYRKLCPSCFQVLREKFGVRCFLGLTATATQSTATSVAEHLGIVHDVGAVIRGGAVPPNLFLSVSCDSDRTQVKLTFFTWFYNRSVM